MRIIDGRKIANNILAELKKKIKQSGTNPCLAIVLVGENPSSLAYIRAKEKAAEQIGVKVRKFFLPKESSESKILEIIKKLNNKSDINGILVQLPLPKGINPDKIIREISPKKDIDGLLLDSGFDSPFILSIWEALKTVKKNLKDKKIFALVNSEVFGKRLGSFFRKKGLEVTIGGSPPFRGLPPKLKADVIITALGKQNFIKSSMIKNNVILIDGGISQTDGNVAGDIDAKDVKEKAKWLSPVPGGVGPITVAFLLKNLVKNIVSD